MGGIVFKDNTFKPIMSEYFDKDTSTLEDVDFFEAVLVIDTGEFFYWAKSSGVMKWCKLGEAV